MSRHKHQPDLAKTVFSGDNDVAPAKCDALISRLLNEHERLEDEIEEQRRQAVDLREERYLLSDIISAYNRVITRYETILLAARSGTCPLQESTLQDLSKTVNHLRDYTHAFVTKT